MTYRPNRKEKAEKTQQAMVLLNEIVKLQLRPSPIHGIGVFAMRNLKKGETLYTDIIPHQFDVPYVKVKTLDKAIRDTLLGHFPQIVNGSHFLYPVTKMSAFLNHSDMPNYDAVNDQALRDIQVDEEITEDYRVIPSWEKVYPWLTRDTI